MCPDGLGRDCRSGGLSRRFSIKEAPDRGSTVVVPPRGREGLFQLATETTRAKSFGKPQSITIFTARNEASVCSFEHSGEGHSLHVKPPACGATGLPVYSPPLIRSHRSVHHDDHTSRDPPNPHTCRQCVLNEISPGDSALNLTLAAIDNR